MANPAHLEKLCEGPKAWNAWREANPNIVPDLGEIQLTLHQRQLGPSNGGPIDLHAADLENAVLRYATLSGADLEGTRLVGADLTHARLDDAKLMGADLTDALLDHADLKGAMLDQAVLFGADLSDTRNLTMAQLEQAFGDASTKLPGNLLPPEKWFPLLDGDEDDDDDYAGWGMAPAEEPAEQSLYEILGLTQKAASEQIRSAYRVLVKKLHPDLNPNDDEAQDRFKRVTTAYRILNDAEQRARYDRGEIDGEGRVNPDFEARRRFRRTAYRYYAAAAGSFTLAACVLVGVWYTVLSVEPQDDTAPQVAVVSQPKRAGRLGEEQRLTQMKPVTPESNLALATEEAASPPDLETPPAAETDVQPPEDAPAEPANAEAMPVPPGTSVQPREPEAVSSPLAEPTPQPDLSAGAPSAATPMQQGEATRQSDNGTAQRPPEKADGAAQMPGGNPPPTSSEATGPAGADAQQAASPVPVEQPAVPALQTAQPTPQQPAPQMGGAPSPLFQGHKSTAGQIKPSAPEGGSVAALPAAGQQQIQAERATQTRSNGGGPRVEKGDMPQPVQRQSSQRPGGRDAVSKVLRTRAIWQALGARKRPLVAIEGVAVAERRAGLFQDLPTNALPGKRQETPLKPTVGAQRKPLEARPATRPQPAAASKAPTAVESKKREARRQQQAVSDILAGGL